MTARILRLLTALFAFVAIASPAAAQAPLAGTGENIQPIARVPIKNINEVELAGDWAFVSDEVGEGDEEGGLRIINISNPEKPYQEGFWSCPGGWADVDLSPDGNLAVLTNGHTVECLDGNTWAAIIDIRDKKNPKLLSTIQDDDEVEYVHTANLDNNLLYLNPQAVRDALPHATQVADRWQCAMRRLVVSPVQPGGTWREVLGSAGLPGSER